MTGQQRIQTQREDPNHNIGWDTIVSSHPIRENPKKIKRLAKIGKTAVQFAKFASASPHCWAPFKIPRVLLERDLLTQKNSRKRSLINSVVEGQMANPAYRKNTDPNGISKTARSLESPSCSFRNIEIRKSFLNSKPQLRTKPFNGFIGFRNEMTLNTSINKTHIWTGKATIP